MKSMAPVARRGILVVGYGNTLRRDDGVGPWVAEQVSGWATPDIEAIATHQLAPELAPRLAAVRTVIFVDACTRDVTENFQFQEVGRKESSASGSHSFGPEALMALTKAVYDYCPRCWLLTIPASDMSFGEDLSLSTVGQATAALARIASLLEPECS